MWQDFESGWPEDWTFTGRTDPPKTHGAWRELAIKEGLELMVSRGAASTLDIDGAQLFESPSFQLPTNLTFLVYDHCDKDCRIELVVDGRVIRSHDLEGTDKLTPVFWAFKRRDRTGVLRIVDENPAAGQGLVLDQITQAN